MKTRKTLIFITVLLAITGIVAFAHLSTREEVPENGIQVTVGEEKVILNIEKLSYEEVTGTYVTGKGEEREVNSPGILVKDVLSEAGVENYTIVSVVADDSYSVEITDEDSEAYLIREEESLRLIVFGDKDSKRNVKNVVEIIVEE